jgi:hypothetical protein
MRILKNSKNHVFFNRSGEHIAGYMIHLNKIEWNFNNLCPTICKIVYNLLHKIFMS